MMAMLCYAGEPDGAGERHLAAGAAARPLHGRPDGQVGRVVRRPGC